jgi:hypothetical protein
MGIMDRYFQGIVCSVDRASRYNYIIKTNLMHYLYYVYSVNQPLHISGIYVAHHQEVYEGRPKNNWNLNVVHELEVVARCAARCRESTQYSSSVLRGVSLG